jgi:hypothetical protein
LQARPAAPRKAPAMALIIRLDWLSLRCCIAAGIVGS